jgi:hypothetical protein
MTRMAAKFLKPEMTIAQEGNAWTIKSTSSLKNHEFTFTPGQEFELTTPDGRQVKVSLYRDRRIVKFLSTGLNGNSAFAR